MAKPRGYLVVSAGEMIALCENIQAARKVAKANQGDIYIGPIIDDQGRCVLTLGKRYRGVGLKPKSRLRPPTPTKPFEELIEESIEERIPTKKELAQARVKELKAKAYDEDELEYDWSKLTSEEAEEFERLCDYLEH